MNATRLRPAPGVAHIAFRYPSKTKPGLYYDCALMVSEDGRPPWWSCECPDYVYREHACKHVRDAERRLAALRSVARHTRRSA